MWLCKRLIAATSDHAAHHGLLSTTIMLFQNCAALLLSTLISTQFASGAAIEQQPMQPASNPSNLPTLADVLTIEPSLSIFYSYARELDLSRLLSDDSARMTLLAPKNKAVMAMHRKPCVILSFPFHSLAF